MCCSVSVHREQSARSLPEGDRWIARDGGATSPTRSRHNAERTPIRTTAAWTEAVREYGVLLVGADADGAHPAPLPGDGCLAARSVTSGRRVLRPLGGKARTASAHPGRGETIISPHLAEHRRESPTCMPAVACSRSASAAAPGYCAVGSGAPCPPPPGRAGLRVAEHPQRQGKTTGRDAAGDEQHIAGHAAATRSAATLGREPRVIPVDTVGQITRDREADNERQQHGLRAQGGDRHSRSAYCLLIPASRVTRCAGPAQIT